MIKNVIRWQNGMVMVFDQAGNQITEYQGLWTEMREKILKDAPQDATFCLGRWGTSETMMVNRDEF